MSDSIQSSPGHRPPLQPAGLSVGGKVFSIGISVIGTAASIVHGLGATIYHLVKLAQIYFNTKPQVEGTWNAKEHHIVVLTNELPKSHIRKGEVGTIQHELHNVRVAALRMIPFLGMQLA